MPGTTASGTVAIVSSAGVVFGVAAVVVVVVSVVTVSTPVTEGSGTADVSPVASSPDVHPASATTNTTNAVPAIDRVLDRPGRTITPVCTTQTPAMSQPPHYRHFAHRNTRPNPSDEPTARIPTLRSSLLGRRAGDDMLGP
jgi:hypothetical protein